MHIKNSEKLESFLSQCIKSTLREAVECYMENKVNDSFQFKASDLWLASFKRKNRIVSRKAIKIVHIVLYKKLKQSKKKLLNLEWIFRNSHLFMKNRKWLLLD